MRAVLQEGQREGIALVYHLDADIPTLQGDPSQIRRLVMNLVNNAAEALNESGGVVTIETDSVHIGREELDAMPFGKDVQAGCFVRLCVKDSGDGIPENALPRVFEPFFTTKGPGRGLGLAAVMGTARAYGGVATAASVESEGTCIRIYLPASNDST